VEGTLAVHTSAGTLPILVYGNEEQKASFVPDLARGEKIGCFVLTEPTTEARSSFLCP
jgi:alkylation response protein AidB-like acyl-CoA dehydrogenase